MSWILSFTRATTSLAFSPASIRVMPMTVSPRPFSVAAPMRSNRAFLHVAEVLEFKPARRPWRVATTMCPGHDGTGQRFSADDVLFLVVLDIAAADVRVVFFERANTFLARLRISNQFGGIDYHLILLRYATLSVHFHDAGNGAQSIRCPSRGLFAVACACSPHLRR